VLTVPRSRDLRSGNVRATLRAYRTSPWRAMIVTPNGGYVWPRPGDSTLPGEVMLAPYESDLGGASWDETTLLRALGRARDDCLLRRGRERYIARQLARES
jgi:hypothetical protein